MMRIRGIGRLRRAARRLRNRFRPGVLILLYHRVVELPSDPYLVGVTPQHFAEHLEILRQQGCIIGLQQLVQALRDGNLPHRAVVVTFDDGYADNLHNAKPLLESYNIPATFFVTTGYIGHEREFWWDELERLLLQPGTLPKTLHLNVNGSTYQWQVGEAAHYTEDDYRCHCWWNIEQNDDPTPRHRLFRSLYQLLHPLPTEQQRQVLDELLAWAGVGLIVRPTHRTLSTDEVVHLAEGGLVEVGTHTVTHPLLSALPAAAQRDEIKHCKVSLEELLGHPVASFSYPHGSRTAQTVAVVRETGFTCACSSLADVVWRDTDCFQLPRLEVRDWNGEAFARRLREWFCD